MQIKTNFFNNTAQELDETPLSKQFKAIKSKYPNALILFNVINHKIKANTYEAIKEDAGTVSEVLGLPLTNRGGENMAGFNAVLIEKYLAKLVRAGYQVALCSDMQTPITL